MLLASEGTAGFPLLTSIIVLPAVGSLICALLSRRRPELIRQTAFLFSTATGATLLMKYS